MRIDIGEYAITHRPRERGRREWREGDKERSCIDTHFTGITGYNNLFGLFLYVYQLGRPFVNLLRKTENKTAVIERGKGRGEG